MYIFLNRFSNSLWILSEAPFLRAIFKSIVCRSSRILQQCWLITPPNAKLCPYKWHHSAQGQVDKQISCDITCLNFRLCSSLYRSRAIGCFWCSFFASSSGSAMTFSERAWRDSIVKSVKEMDRQEKFAVSKAIVVLRTVKVFAKQSLL